MRLVLLLAISAAVLVACGGSSQTGPDAAPNAAEPASGRATSSASPSATAAATNAQRWSDPATWGGALPPAGALVVIPAGKTVLLDTATSALRGLTIEGSLLAADTDVAITTDVLMVRGGRLAIGTANEPYTRRATITLTGTSTADAAAAAGFGAKVLGVAGGVLELHGTPGIQSWTRLAGGDVAAGARRITLDSAAGWRVGDRLVIATSSPEMSEHDLAEIAAVSGNTIDLKEPLKHRHFGSVRQVGDRSIDVRAEVGLLNRNIVVQGDAASEALKIGGHAMFMAGDAGATVQIAGVEFARMGQHDQLGRYPLHFHLMAAGCKSCYLRDSSVRDSVQRGIVVHGTQGVTVSGNVVFNTVGHNIVVEDEAATGNLIERNLALVNRQPSPLHTQSTLAMQEDRMPSNYWFKAGLNTVSNNSAAGSFFNGFNYVGIDGGEDDSRIGVPIDFRNNTAHAAMGREGVGEGDFDITGGLLISTEARRPATDRILGTLVYHNNVGLWPEETGEFLIEGFIAAENGLQVENRGVGNKVRLKDGLFVASLSGSTAPRGGLIHIQYGSDVVLENNTFAGWDTIGFDGTDTGPMQASYRITGARFIGPKPQVQLTDLARYQFDDDSMLPRGFYVVHGARWLVTPQCTDFTVGFTEADGPDIWLRCPNPVSHAELEVRDRLDSTFNTKVNPFLVRSDGLRYRLGDAPGAEGQGAGSHSTTVVYNEPSLDYRVDAPAAPAGWAVRLSDAAAASATPDLRANAAWITLSMPVANAPRGVYRTGMSFDRPDLPRAENALRAAASLADHMANPKTTYFHDAAGGSVRVQVGGQWVIVTP
jgi:hypothetical protein